MKPATTFKAVSTLIVAAAATACSGGALGNLGDILTGGSAGGQAASGTITAEIQEVRPSQQQIIVRTQDGQQGGVLYDQNTRVVYQNQDYPVSSLEQGDVVDMRLQQVQQGYYADLIQVVTPVQDRQGGYRGSPQPDVYRMEGTISQIDLQQWTFTLAMTQGGTVIVHVPATVTGARERLRQYQVDDYVRVEIRPTDDQNAELVQFGWDTT